MAWGGTVEITETDRHEVAEVARTAGGDLWGRFHQLLGELAFRRFLGTEPTGYVVRAVPPKAKYVEMRPGKDDDDTRLVLVLLLANYAKASIVGWVTAGHLRFAGKNVNLSRDLRSDFPERKESDD
jgi:hypothetical protein